MYFKKQKRTSYKILFIFITLVVFLFSLILIINVVFYFTILKNQSTFDIKKTFEYRYNEVNNFKKTSKRGFVTLPNHLEPEEYLSYFNEETGSTIIVTNFYGGTEYKCSGNCYCEHDRSRRTSFSNVLSKSLVIFFSAFSIPMALNLAKDTFFDQCSHEFDDLCSFPSHVEVEIDDCALVTKMSEFQEDKQNGNVRQGEEQEEHTPKPEDNNIMFHCKAHCIPLEDPFVPDDKGSFFQGEEFLRIGHQNVGLCEALVLEIKVSVPSVIQGVHLSPEQAHEMSKLEFIQQYPFHSWCISKSLMKYEWFSEEGQQAIQGYLRRATDSFHADELFKTPFFCYGYKLFYEPQQNGWMVNNQELHNINCVRD